MRTIYLITLALFLITGLFAQAPADYYIPANGKSGKELKSSLYYIIKEGTRLSYGSGTNATWSGFEKTDLHPDGYVWDMYSNNQVPFPGEGRPASGMNIEHSVAKSWWGGSNNDAYKDLHHLNPSNMDANSRKGSFPPGEIEGKGSWSNGVITVGNNSAGTEYTGTAFEVIDEYKGDFARAYLYMFTCYENYNWTGSSAPTFMRSGETYPMLKQWAQNLLVSWSRLDPVSTKEVNRNEAVYKIQQNRNPYIDHPELVEYLWGDKVGQVFTTIEPTTPFLSLPVKGATVTFGDVHFSESALQRVKVKGKNLTGNLTVSISGSDAARFTLSASTLTPVQVLEGVEVNVVYTPTESITHSATLTIDGGGLSAPLTVLLNGRGVDNFMTLAPINVTANGFTARWTPVSGATDYELSVYKVEQQVSVPVLLLDDHLTKKPAGWTTEGYTDFSTENSFIRLASGKQNGTLETPSIDLSEGGSVIVTAKRFGSDVSQLKVYLDNELVATFDMSEAVADYEVEIDPASATSRIKLLAQSGKRVLVDRLQVFTEGERATEVLLSGYPRSVGNGLSYVVTGLDPSVLNYSYSVRATGVGVDKSTGREPVRLPTSVDDPSEKEPIQLYVTNEYLYITCIEAEANVAVYSLDGRLLHAVQASDSRLSLPLKTRGVVLVVVRTPMEVKSFKAILR